MKTTVKKIYISKQTKECKRPLFSVSVPAGFPSPAESYIEEELDLNEYFIKNPAATFFVRVTGDSMVDSGIFSDDLLIVDRSVEPTDKKVVIAAIDGELTVKRIRLKDDKIVLVPENNDFEPIVIEKGMELDIWGVVTHVVHAL